MKENEDDGVIPLRSTTVRTWEQIAEDKAKELIDVCRILPEAKLDERCTLVLGLVENGYWSSDLDLLFFRMIESEVSNQLKLDL